MQLIIDNRLIYESRRSNRKPKEDIYNLINKNIGISYGK